MIGLTATPVPETVAFFNSNVVINYTLEKSIIEGVNVDYRIYRIKTRETADGGVNEVTGKQLAEVGADIVVAGNYVFKAPQPTDAIALLNRL